MYIFYLGSVLENVIFETNRTFNFECVHTLKIFRVMRDFNCHTIQLCHLNDLF